jgi:hypothetical protein
LTIGALTDERLAEVREKADALYADACKRGPLTWQYAEAELTIRLLDTIDARDAEIARLRELYHDEHDWASALFPVVEAVRVWAKSDDEKDVLGLMDALAKYEGEAKR